MYLIYQETPTNLECPESSATKSKSSTPESITQESSTSEKSTGSKTKVSRFLTDKRKLKCNLK